MKKIATLPTLCLCLALLMTACSTPPAAPPVATPLPAAEKVIAAGTLVPNQSIYLAFKSNGRVEELLVHQGDQVIQGQVLARLGDRAQVEASLAVAQAQVVAAQQAVDLLVRTANLAHARAWQASLDAQKVRASAQLAWDRLDLTTIQTDIDTAQAEVTSRLTDLENAQKDLAKYSNLPASNATRRTYEDSLRTAQINYDTAVQKAEDLVNRRDSLHSALDLALATEAEAKRAYQASQNGPDPDQLALAQAQLDAASTQAAAAQAALDDYDLKAPFAGTVAEVNGLLHQMVSPQAWVVALADPSQWFVDTTDLTEMDVVRVSLGQSVLVTADALPGITMAGVVESISAAPKIQGGDVLYTVRIRLSDPDPALLWGMTMEITF
jgi:HlyD family secretion protein